MIEIDYERFQKHGVTMFPFLAYAERQILLTELKNHPMVKAPIRKGNNIEQHYEEAELLRDQMPKTSQRITELEQILKENFVMPIKHSFNCFRLQRYRPKLEVGIAPHTDGERFMNPIAILVLEHGGDFCVYNKKGDKNPSMIVPATVGDCILLTTSVVHAVVNVRQDRYTLTSRIDTMRGIPL